MKKFIISSLLVVIAFSSHSQKSVVEGVKEYKDIKEKMYISSVVEVEGKMKKDLINAFKSWGAISFNNLKEIIVSETEEQIALVYITTIPKTAKILLTTNTTNIKLYVRLIAEFKDGKVRLSFYDDGNVAILPAYYGNILSPGVSARSYYMADAYNALLKLENEWDYKKPENDKDFNKLKNSNYKFMMAYQKDLENTLLSATEGIKNPSATSPKRKDDF